MFFFLSSHLISASVHSKAIASTSNIQLLNFEFYPNPLRVCLSASAARRRVPLRKAEAGAAVPASGAGESRAVIAYRVGAACHAGAASHVGRATRRVVGGYL